MFFISAQIANAQAVLLETIFRNHSTDSGICSNGRHIVKKMIVCGYSGKEVMYFSSAPSLEETPFFYQETKELLKGEDFIIDSMMKSQDDSTIIEIESKIESKEDRIVVRRLGENHLFIGVREKDTFFKRYDFFKIDRKYFYLETRWELTPKHEEVINNFPLPLHVLLSENHMRLLPNEEDKGLDSLFEKIKK